MSLEDIVSLFISKADFIYAPGPRSFRRRRTAQNVVYQYIHTRDIPNWEESFVCIQDLKATITVKKNLSLIFTGVIVLNGKIYLLNDAERHENSSCHVLRLMKIYTYTQMAVLVSIKEAWFMRTQAEHDIVQVRGSTTSQCPMVTITASYFTFTLKIWRLSLLVHRNL